MIYVFPVIFSMFFRPWCLIWGHNCWWVLSKRRWIFVWNLVNFLVSFKVVFVWFWKLFGSIGSNSSMNNCHLVALIPLNSWFVNYPSFGNYFSSFFYCQIKSMSHLGSAHFVIYVCELIYVSFLSIFSKRYQSNLVIHIYGKFSRW